MPAKNPDKRADELIERIASGKARVSTLLKLIEFLRRDATGILLKLERRIGAITDEQQRADGQRLYADIREYAKRYGLLVETTVEDRPPAGSGHQGSPG